MAPDTVSTADFYEICDGCFEPGELYDTKWTRKAAGDPDGPDYVVRLCSICLLRAPDHICSLKT